MSREGQVQAERRNPRRFGRLLHDLHPGAPGLSADFGGERPRFKRLTDWLGPDFDGAIAFDDPVAILCSAARIEFLCAISTLLGTGRLKPTRRADVQGLWKCCRP